MANWKDITYFVIFGIFGVAIPLFYEIIYILFWWGALGNSKNRCVVALDHPLFKKKPIPLKFGSKS